MIQQLVSHATAPGDNQNALAAVQRLFYDAELLCMGLAAPAGAIGDDSNLRHKQVLRNIPKPQWLCLTVRFKKGPVQCQRRSNMGPSLDSPHDFLQTKLQTNQMGQTNTGQYAL